MAPIAALDADGRPGPRAPGGAPWSPPLRLATVESCPVRLRRLLGRRAVDLEVPLLDLARATPDELLDLPGPKLAGLALALLRGAASGRDGALRTVERFAPRFRALGRAPGGRDDLALLLEYTAITSHTGRDEVLRRIDAALGLEARDTVKMLGERLFDEGKAEGKAEGQRELMQRLLEGRFGALSAATRRRLAAASTAELGRWATRLLTAERLEDVLGAPRRSAPRRGSGRRSTRSQDRLQGPSNPPRARTRTPPAT